MTDTTVAPRVQTRGADRSTTTTAPTRFADLGLSPRVVDALAKRGHRGRVPDPVAGDAGRARRAATSSRSRAPGSGKTLAFAIPLVETLTPSDRAPTALILAPTRELASQVTEEFRAIADVRHLKVAAVYGGVGIGPQAKHRAPRRHRDRHPRPAARPGGAQAAAPGPRPHGRARRSRPHARHGVPARRPPDPGAPAPGAPDDAVLGDARRRDRPARRALHTHDAVRHEIKDDRPAVADGHASLHRRRATPGSSARWSASSPPTAGSRSSSSARSAARTASPGTSSRRVPRGRAARRHVAAPARARARPLRGRPQRRADRDRRRRARARPRAHQPRDQLRSARRRQGVRPPRRPHRSRRARRRRASRS